MAWQNAIAQIAVILATAFLVYRVWRLFFQRVRGCGGCGSCEQGPTVTSLTLLQRDEIRHGAPAASATVRQPVE